MAPSADRAETVLLIGLTSIWLASLPLFTTVAGAEWMTVESPVLAEQSRDIAVDAVLDADAAPVEVDSRSPSMVEPTVAATWVGRAGQPAEGTVPVRSGARAGDHLTVWLDAAGTVVDRPMSTRTAAGILVAGTAAAWLALGPAFAGRLRGIRGTFDRRRSRSWTDEWASFDAGRHRRRGPGGSG